MKFFAVFALIAIFAIAVTTAFEYESEYDSEYAEADPTELTRVERSYGGAKCGKAVLIACAPQIKKIKCKGKY